MPNLEKKSQPSESQIREFWEWCGCRQDEIDPSVWICLDGTRYTRYGGMPTPDMTFLFKYAVPKLEGYKIDINRTRFVTAPRWFVQVYNADNDGTSSGEDPALALFWAIYSALDLSPPM
uniref:Uncharacterized protein n=1 Tax=viral metagenome TaxID=1070528 RepID=A0A6M3LPA0_9ZZZZ